MGNLTTFETLFVTHLVMDWIFQGHKEATRKSEQPKYLLRHCAIYTLGFIPAFLHLNINLLWLALLFTSHLILDERTIENWIIKRVKGMTDENTSPELKPVVATGVDQTLHILVLAIITSLI